MLVGVAKVEPVDPTKLVSKPTKNSILAKKWSFEAELGIVGTQGRRFLLAAI